MIGSTGRDPEQYVVAFGENRGGQVSGWSKEYHITAIDSEHRQM